jgi:alpha-galactosidase
VNISRRHVVLGMALGPALLRAAEQPKDFRDLAPAPPMGWNSWDSFGPTITEAQARANAEVMAARLAPHGYDIFTIDIQWYEPGAVGYDYRKGATLALDDFGRLIPAPNRFPSALPGSGFKPLADYIHHLGLRFGIHMMRGVPRQAVGQNTPIRGTGLHAADIADQVNVCEWNTDMYGVDMSKPGAQAYYDSVFQLYASWGVDFIKADDMSRPYLRNAPEIHAIRRAIDRCGRPMTLSLSPGETPLVAAADVVQNANMWRISDDFWDTWPALHAQFERLNHWSVYRRAGNWPDADMLPLGVLEMGRRKTRFTPDEQVTLLTLWSIARSPLIMGGDLRKIDDFTLSLLVNDEVLAINRASRDNDELFKKDGLAAWRARSVAGDDVYVALFNLRDPTPSGTAAEVSIQLADLGIPGKARVRDLWRRADVGTVETALTRQIACHGAGLFRVSPA